MEKFLDNSIKFLKVAIVVAIVIVVFLGAVVLCLKYAAIVEKGKNTDFRSKQTYLAECICLSNNAELKYYEINSVGIRIYCSNGASYYATLHNTVCTKKVGK